MHFSPSGFARVALFGRIALTADHPNSSNSQNARPETSCHLAGQSTSSALKSKRWCWLTIRLAVLASVVFPPSNASAQCDPQEVAKVLALDGAPPDQFGLSVSISGDSAIVGSEFDDDLGAWSGSAYVFEEVGGVWTRIAKLLASDGAAGGAFGHSVSISGNTAVVGAYNDGYRGTGAAYVFERIGGVWIQTAKLLASDGAAGDAFGFSVSISGDTAITGAHGDDDRGRQYSGSAYVFERIGGVWTQVAKLLASDGAAGDAFGHAVSISGDTAVVGALADGDLGAYSGSAYVFERAGGVWTQTAKILAADGTASDCFGFSVSISGDTAVVGACYDDDLADRSGSAYVFGKVGGVWTQIAKLLAPDGAAGDQFGCSVSINVGAVVVGACYDDDLADRSGSAYVFKNVGGVWTQVAKLLASDGAAEDYFGTAVSISDETSLIGARGDELLTGSAYVFDVGCGPLMIRVAASCPSGGPIRVSWFGATPRRLAALIFASEHGAFTLPPNMPCAGIRLGVGYRQLQVVWTGNIGPDGSGSIGRTAGPNACGGYLQLLDLATCTTSNVAQIQ